MVDATGTDIRRHPGKGRRRARTRDRGRQVLAAALTEIRSLLADRPRRRDLLIEYLHDIQDKYCCISAAHLAALAAEMNIPMAEAYEVATFYAHFDVLADAEAPPPAVTVRVCDSLSCQLMGAEQLREALAATLDPQSVRVIRAPCMGRCDAAPVAEVGHYHAEQANVASISKVIDERRFDPVIPAYLDYQSYVDDGGYALYRRLLAGELSYEEVSRSLADSALRGLGGAGFPTASKWDIVRGEPGPRLMAINADEGEPGTIKDRHYLERDPHRFLEGSLVGAWAVEAETVYIYLRDEYPAIRHILASEIARLEQEGIIRADFIVLRRGAGAYICGEESAMIESIEGKRGYPRQRPPYVAQLGLFGRPTLVNNVETLYWVRDIVERGSDWFASQGVNGSRGLRSFSVSGRVRDPGMKLAPAGITMQDLLDDYCGGMADGHRFKAYLPGGASGGIMPAGKADVPLDFGTLQAHDCFIGSAAIIVLSDQDDMKAVALNLMRFFADESCGQCTPCRAGTEKTVQLLEQDNWDAELLADLAEVMSGASICGLGQAAANPVNSVFKYFPDDILAREV